MGAAEVIETQVLANAHPVDRASVYGRSKRRTVGVYLDPVVDSAFKSFCKERGYSYHRAVEEFMRACVQEETVRLPS